MNKGIVAVLICVLGGMLGGSPAYGADSTRTHKYNTEVRYNRSWWKSMDTILPDSLGDALLPYPSELFSEPGPSYFGMLFSARVVATIGGKIRKVQLEPMYSWSGTPRDHKSWSIAAAVVENLLKSSRLHSITDSDYKGPLRRETFYKEWVKIFDSPELAKAVQHMLTVEYLFYVNIGSGDLPHSTELLNIRYY